MIGMNIDEHIARDIGRVVLNKLKLNSTDKVEIRVVDDNNVLVTVKRDGFKDDPEIYSKNVELVDM